MTDYRKLKGDERQRTLDTELARLNAAVLAGTLNIPAYETAFHNVRFLTVENEEFTGKSENTDKTDKTPGPPAIDIPSERPSIPTQVANASLPTGETNPRSPNP